MVTYPNWVLTQSLSFSLPNDSSARFLHSAVIVHSCIIGDASDKSSAEMINIDRRAQPLL